MSSKIEYRDQGDSEKESNSINKVTIILPDGTQKSLYHYEEVFKEELRSKREIDQVISRRYEIPNGFIRLSKAEPLIEITGLLFTGALKQYDLSSSQSYTLVDNVWLIMKSIFEEKTFSISENGIIVENKK